jgi:hypothetical protein
MSQTAGFFFPRSLGLAPGGVERIARLPADFVPTALMPVKLIPQDHRSIQIVGFTASGIFPTLIVLFNTLFWCYVEIASQD